MDKKRRKEPQWWAERKGEGIVQRSQPRKARFESSATRRRFAQGLLLREDDGYEEEADISQDSKRPEQQDKQKPSGLEMLGENYGRC